MGKKDKRVDAYIAESAAFARPILKHLRKVVHSGCPEVEETIKWRFPVFMHKGMLCSMAAFKQHCTFGFWKHKLIITRNSACSGRERDAMGQMGRITAIKDLPTTKVLTHYVQRAAHLNEAGISMPRPAKPRATRNLVVPTGLAAALKRNQKAQRTFEGFSHSHKREYVEWITEAKREDTRARRLKTTITWLAQGKPRNWKYVTC